VDEEVLDFLGDIEVSVVGGIVSAGNGVVLSVAFILTSECSRLGSSCDVFLGLRLLRGYNFLFFSRVDVVVFVVIHFKSHVKVLVLHFVLASLPRRGFIRLARRLAVVVGIRTALLVGLLVVFFLLGKFVVFNLQGVASRLCKVVFL
jgi:hypothetical protein